jgi:hypothetical protein
MCKRYALIYGRDDISAYLPDNYRVLAEIAESAATMADGTIIAQITQTVIEGRDVAGWTLDGYVLPRLASGLHFGQEIDLSHPVMKQIAEPTS